MGMRKGEEGRRMKGGDGDIMGREGDMEEEERVGKRGRE